MKTNILDLGKDGEYRRIVRNWDDVKECSLGEGIILPFSDIGEVQAIFLGLRKNVMQADYLLVDYPKREIASFSTLMYNPYNESASLIFSNGTVEKNKLSEVLNGLGVPIAA